ncbi:MAG: hypothetical protein ACFFE3_12140 [Candidatus Thorarchaeota archaeon]
MRVPLESLNVPIETRIRFTPRVLERIFNSIVLPRTISLLHGPERAPLSIIAHNIAVSAAKSNDDAKCVFLDSGSNYSPSLVRMIASSSDILERILVGNIMGLSDTTEMIRNLPRLSGISIIILDSLTGTLNLTGGPGTKGRQRELFHTLEILRKTVNQYDTHLLITDFSSKNWVSGEHSPIGGNVLSHAVDSVVRVDRLKKGENLIRILTERCTYSRNPPGIIVRADSKGIRSIK